MNTENNNVKKILPQSEAEQRAKVNQSTFQKENAKPSFPALHHAITVELLTEAERILAPNGYRLQQGFGQVISRNYLPKQDLVDVMLMTYAFVHNDRVKTLAEIHTLIKLHESDLAHFQSFLEEEMKAVTFFNKRKTSIRSWNQIIRETNAKISALKVVLSILNR